MVYARFEAGRMRKLKYKSCRAKIVYPGTEASKKIVYAEIEAITKDCLRKCLRIV